MKTHEEYVTYQQAELLKEFGFDWPCRYRATKEDAPDGQYWNYPCLDELSNSELGSREFAIPTQAVACRWLREVYEMDISVYYVHMNKTYWSAICWIPENRPPFEGFMHEEATHEETMSWAISFALHRIKSQKEGKKYGI